MLLAGVDLHRHVGVVGQALVDGLTQALALGAGNPASPAIGEIASLVGGGEVASYGDLTGQHVDSQSESLENAPADVGLRSAGVVAKQGKVPWAASRGHSCGHGYDSAQGGTPRQSI